MSEQSALIKALVTMAKEDGADAYMYPRDLDDFQSQETNAKAFSVRMSNPEKGSTEPLFRLSTIHRLLSKGPREHNSHKALVEALEELVYLKDQVKNKTPAEYHLRKPKAWAQARAALAKAREVPA